MNFNKRAQQAQQTGFQMAPMVDIMFLLLIFFMAAIIYAKWENKLEVNVPTADKSDRTARSVGEVVINVDKEGKIYINSFMKTPDQLQALLGQVTRVSKDQPVIIRADADTAHKHFVRVLNICRRLGITNVSIAHLSAAAEGSAD